jgi:superfamily II DNA helicase RecQ
MADAQDDLALRDEAERHLKALAGDHARLRDDQWTAISALVADRRRALVVQRTGWGKSAVYFVATALLRSRGAGPTVIVSPLLALMRNQVAAAGRAGIHARTINSANTQEWEQVYAEVSEGKADVLLVSPERLNSAPGPATTCSCSAGHWTASRCGWRWWPCPPRISGSAGSPPTSRTAACRDPGSSTR